MRKLIPCALFLLVIFLCSCKKEHSAITTPDRKTYQLTFTVAGSAQQINALNGKRGINSLKTDALTGIAGYMDLLYYAVLDPNNNVVHLLKQDSTFSNFGMVTDTLPAGTYNIIMIAGKKGLVSRNASNFINQPGFLIYYDLVNGVVPWEDTFYKEFSVTVANSNIVQNVTLNRIVGELQTTIQDTIPTTANSLVVSVQDEVFELVVPGFGTYNAKPLVDSIILSSAEKGQPNFTVNNLIGNTVAPMSVAIKCYDASNKLLGNVTVTNVTCQQGVRTILTGKLFGTGVGYGLGITPWNPPITQNF